MPKSTGRTCIYSIATQQKKHAVEAACNHEPLIFLMRTGMLVIIALSIITFARSAFAGQDQCNNAALKNICHEVCSVEWRGGEPECSSGCVGMIRELRSVRLDNANQWYITLQHAKAAILGRTDPETHTSAFRGGVEFGGVIAHDLCYDRGREITRLIFPAEN